MSIEADPRTAATVTRKLCRSLTRGSAIEKSIESTSKPAAALDDVRVRALTLAEG